MTKLSHYAGDHWIAHSHPAIFTLKGAPHPRIVATAPRGDPIVFRNLIGFATPPYFLLYVLHTPRGEGEAGRYQSPSLEQQDVHTFLDRFGAYLQSDGRYDLWVHSPADNATLVWDRHNLIFAYGSLPTFADALRALGFAEGEPRIDFPHEHHYRAEFDGDAAAVLNFCKWSYSPLRPEDEQ